MSCERAQGPQRPKTQQTARDDDPSRAVCPSDSGHFATFSQKRISMAATCARVA